MLEPKTRHLRDYKRCFYGCRFEEEPELRLKLKEFLGKKNMEFHPLVKPGTQSWPEMTVAMNRSAFCVFETATKSPHVHVEIGYALARQLNVLLLLDKDRPDTLPANLGGAVRIQYDKKNLNILVAQQLDNPKFIPRDWFSVEDRLLMLLKSATPLDRKYFRLLVLSPDPAQYYSVGTLVGSAGQALRGSSNLIVADFLRRFDELIEYKEFEQRKPDDLLNIPATPTLFDAQEVRLDKDYRAFLAAELNIPLR